MNDILVLMDTREKDNENIKKYFKEKNVMSFTTTLKTGDYLAIKYDCGFYVEKGCVVDLKNKILELAGNLCGSVANHEKEKRKLERSKELGFKRFVFLVYDKKVKCIDDLIEWSSEITKVKGTTLAKVLLTMQKKYGCEFIFYNDKKTLGKKILELLK